MKIITIKSNGLGRYEDVSPFIMTDKSLELKVELPKLNGEFFLTGENNGKSFKTVLTGDNVTTLHGLSAGELNIEIKHYLKGTLIKTYKVEPLILKDVDESLSGAPEINALRAEITALKEALAKEQRTAEERETELSAVIGKLNKNLSALILFAYTDYKFNVFLDGGTRTEFLEKFGFALTDGQINEIFGGNEND